MKILTSEVFTCGLDAFAVLCENRIVRSLIGTIAGLYDDSKYNQIILKRKIILFD